MGTQSSQSSDRTTAVGADVGATLVKLALRSARGETTTELLPVEALAAVARRIDALGPERVGLTGGGAPRLAAQLAAPAVCIGEFEAWAAGARELLAREAEQPERFLLVSVGTGTSAMLVEPEAVSRVGGSALGGGTVVGLAAALTGERDFAAIARNAERGDRSLVDLRISDIYPHGDFLLPGEVNAASFAKLARETNGGAPRPGPGDLAHAIMGLVGENLGLICAGLALRFDVEPIVFGGSTLCENPTLRAILATVCLALGRSPRFLADGQFTGALGALALGAASGTALRR